MLRHPECAGGVKYACGTEGALPLTGAQADAVAGGLRYWRHDGAKNDDSATACCAPYRPLYRATHRCALYAARQRDCIVAAGRRVRHWECAEATLIKREQFTNNQENKTMTVERLAHHW